MIIQLTTDVSSKYMYAYAKYFLQIYLRFICLVKTIEEYSSKRGLSPIWFILRKMATQDFVYHYWQWLAVTLK